MAEKGKKPRKKGALHFRLLLLQDEMAGIKTT